mmetsp:Transcript_117397/g.252402  ORF Transcript_117397/g.252402 Transcript_117397/m.252402 type:complete len:169 (+) Transcript_117397:34-540(+)
MPKKKGKKKEIQVKEPELTEEDEIVRLDSQTNILQEQVKRMQIEVMSKVEEETALKQNVRKMEEDLRDFQRSKFIIASDLTRQYKAMLVEKDENIRRLHQKIESVDNNLNEVKSRYEDLKTEKEADLQSHKNKEKSLDDDIKSMSRNFAQMLDNTLEQMKTKVTSANE